jgi:hypothetical protein
MTDVADWDIPTVRRGERTVSLPPAQANLLDDLWPTLASGAFIRGDKLRGYPGVNVPILNSKLRALGLLIKSAMGPGGGYRLGDLA